MTKRPTMKDVADLAQVSKTTVSHVINSTRNVEESTRQRVLDAIEELRYRPSAIARSLTTTRTNKIGVIVADVSNHFFSEVLLGIEDILQPRNYGIMVCNTDEVLERESHYLELLLGQRVEGVIAAATSQRWSVISQAEQLRTPIVFVDRMFAGLDGPYVGVDDTEGVRLGVCHLIERGYREIGILAGFQRLSTMQERLASFCNVLNNHGISPPDDWIVTSPLSVAAGKVAMEQILALPARPRALFISNNLLCLGALLALKEQNMRCPADIAIVGFDDHPWAAVSEPPLTVVRQPSRQLGQVAAETLLSLIRNDAPATTQIRLACELVVRQST